MYRGALLRARLLRLRHEGRTRSKGGGGGGTSYRVVSPGRESKDGEAAQKVKIDFRAKRFPWAMTGNETMSQCVLDTTILRLDTWNASREIAIYLGSRGFPLAGGWSHGGRVHRIESTKPGGILGGLPRKPGREESCARMSARDEIRGVLQARLLKRRAARKPDIPMPNDRTRLYHRRQSLRGKRCTMGPGRETVRTETERGETSSERRMERAQDERGFLVIIGPELLGAELPTAYAVRGDWKPELLWDSSYRCPFPPAKRRRLDAGHVQL